MSRTAGHSEGVEKTGSPLRSRWPAAIVADSPACRSSLPSSSCSMAAGSAQAPDVLPGEQLALPWWPTVGTLWWWAHSFSGQAA